MAGFIKIMDKYNKGYEGLKDVAWLYRVPKFRVFFILKLEALYDRIRKYIH